MAEVNEKQEHRPSLDNLPPEIKEKLEQSTVAPAPVGVENIVTRDGFRLHPQPTSDPLDPLNWTSFQKHTILAIVMFLYDLDFHLRVLMLTQVATFFSLTLPLRLFPAFRTSKSSMEYPTLKSIGQSPFPLLAWLSVP